jgi:tyrosyl-tRNA synthetase
MNFDNLLSRGVSELIDPGHRFRKKLEADPTKVVVKFGVDPTRPDLHLGHAVCLRKLREFQQLGCRIVLVVGDFTAMIGDPTGKNKLRPELTLTEIHANMQTYLAQAGQIIDIQTITIVQNSTWYMTFDDFWLSRGNPLPFAAETAHLMQSYIAERSQWEVDINKVRQFISLKNIITNFRKVTQDQLIQRDMFAERKKAGEAIFMNEMVYPILQGIDSLVISKAFGSCDLEIGGTDQHFNMLMGRQMQERDNPPLPPQAVLTLEILEGTDGKEKMSKSLGNYVGLTDTPSEIFGKTMRIPDELIVRWATLTTELDPTNIEKRLKDKENPRNLKVELAKAIVTTYHGAEAATKAENEFGRLHTAGGSGVPDDIPEVRIEEGNWNIIELLARAKLIATKSDGRRLIDGKGVRVDGELITTHTTDFEISSKPLIVQVGKRKFAKILA